MTFSEVKQLLDAGFTKDEIMAFEDPAKAPEKVPEKDPAADPAKVPEKDPAADPAKVPEKDPAKAPAADPAKVTETDPAISALNENISKLIRTIQSSNLRMASMDKTSEEDMATQVDKIMQGIIRPELKEVK